MNLRTFCGHAVLSLSFAVAALLPHNSDAAPGELDPTFGTNGKVTTDFSGNVDVGNAAAVQSDGKIVVAGFTRAGADITEDFALARYNGDGSLDSTFGTGGRVTGGFSSTADRANAVAIQPDGKIVAAGSSEGFFALIRFNSNGSIDPSFGPFGDGVVRTNVSGGGTSQINAVVIQGDGKIVAAGRVGDATAHTLDFAVLRYKTDGGLDTAFGTGGGTNTDFFSGNDAALALVMQPDGKFVAAGSASRGDSTSPDFALVRLNPDGSRDSTFGSGGKVTTDFSSSQDGIYGIALQSDGQIVAAGFTYIPSENNDKFALARYKTDGGLDADFGSGGKVISDLSATTDEAHAVVVQPDGRILAAGIADVSGNALDFALARYNSNGSPDSSFGTGGKVTTAFSTTADFDNALVLQSSDKLVAVGGAGDGDFALARYDLVPSGKLLNIATRLRVQTGDKVLIGGFIITGSEDKKVILRAIGPSLGNAGVQDALQNPQLDLYRGDGTLVGSNDDWKSTQQTEIEATGIPPGNDLESALVRSLAPGAYTAIVRGKNNTSGVGLVEAYDLSQATASKLANISTRGFVETGDNVMIGGLIVGGPSGASARVVVRAIGPSLAAAGVSDPLLDPTLEIYDSQGTVVGTNDDWKTTQQAEIEAANLAPADERESAVLRVLPLGSYTAIVRGKNNTPGVGLVEVYNLE